MTMEDTMTEKKLRHTGRTVEHAIRTTATPEEVWAAWADPDRVAHWFAESARGSMSEGSTFTWGWESHDFETPMQVLLAQRPRRFALSAPWEGAGPTIIEVCIEREADETVVRLIHSGFGDDADFDEEYRGTYSGWLMALTLLKHYLEHYLGRARHQIMVMRKAAFDYEDIRSWHHEEEKLGRWLTSEGRIPALGERFQLRLKDGSTITGQVLADAGHEVALSWEEMQGVLELKSWGSTAHGRNLGLRFSSWLPTVEQKVALRGLLGDALEALAELVGSASTPA